MELQKGLGGSEVAAEIICLKLGGRHSAIGGLLSPSREGGAAKELAADG